MRAKCPRWLVPNWSSKPSAVVRFGVYITPALLISRSMRGWAARSSAAAERTESREVRSRAWTVTSPEMRAAARPPFSGSRTARTTLAPRSASIRAVSKPSPVLAPVTTATLPCWSGMCCSVQSPLMSSSCKEPLVCYGRS